MKTFDIAICGAGLVGQCLALALSQKTDLNILLFDAKSHSPLSQQTLDTRTLALNTFSQHLLTQLQVWPDLQAMAEPIINIQISEQGAFGKTFLKAADIPVAALGHVIEIADLQRVLLKKLVQQSERLTILENASLMRFESKDSAVDLCLQHHETTQDITCQWLIAADSSQSFIRKQLNIPCQQRDYRQSAIVSVIQLQQAAQGQAFERFLKQGVLAILPLTQQRCGTVLTVDTDQAQQYLALPDDAYLALLQQQFGRQLGPFINIGPRQHYPLQLVLAQKLVIDRVLLVGNAAHTINPIGAQGLNLGLHDVACLVDFFQGHLTSDQLNDKLLQRNQRLAQFSDHCARLFNIDFCPINVSRRLGLLLLEHSHTLKQHFTRRMMGY